ncbi:depolymerase [Rugosimonospora africana]|uniref:Depolymerase n=2 Tax=Rugosimonospora africana TaxID=556532 RepID=A0A8J3VQ22_9ACTN|nr:depolymerase [Rugosimonospora africana]
MAHMKPLPRIGAATVTALLVLLGLAAPAPAAGPSAVPPVDGTLRAYHISGVYVSGVSSGGYMATQLQVAYSSRIRGAAIFAAGPYYCAQNNASQAVYGCGQNLWPDYLPTLEADASLWSGYRWIDPIGNLSGQPVYVYHGTADSTVAGSLTSDLASFYRHFGASVQYVTGPAGHSWVTPYGPLGCTATASPYLDNCGTDVENAFLGKLFGGVTAPNTGALSGTLTRFNQSGYAVGGNPAGLSMGSKGFVYVPASCAAGATCKLMVALHGCSQGYDAVGTAFVDDANLNQYADTNAMIVLYPQATASAVNPYGCWDWWGYLGATNYPIHGGAQVETIMNEVRSLGG